MAQKRNAWQEALASFQRLTQGAGQAVQSFTNNPIGRSVVSTAMNSNPITQNFNMARQMAQPVLPLIRPQVQSFSQKIVPQMRPITQNIMSNPLVKTYTNLAQGYKTNLDNVRNTAGTFLSNNPNFSTSPLGAALSGNWSQSGKSLVNLPNYYNQLEANKVKAWQSGDPRLQKQVVEGDVTAVLNTIGGPTGTVKTKINKQLEPAVKNLRHLLSSREVYLLDEFTDAIRSGKGRGALGQLGRDVHAMTAEAFGRKAADTWSNKKIADAWQYVFKRLSEGRNSIGMGLSVNDVSDAFAKKGSSKILGQKIGGEIVDQRTGLKQKAQKLLEQSDNASPSNLLDNQPMLQGQGANTQQVINPSPSSLSQGVKGFTQKGSYTNTRMDQIASKFRGNTPTKSVLGDFYKEIETGRKIRDVANTKKGGGFKMKGKADLLDRLSPIYEYVKLAGNPAKIAAEKNPYKQMRLLAGISGKTDAFLQTKLAPVLQRERSRLEDLSALLAFDRERELIGRGLMRKRNLGDINTGTVELQTKYGVEGFRSLQQSADEIRTVGNEMLDSLKDAGIIDEQTFSKIRANNEFYTPFEAIDHLADNLEKGRGTGSYNVASQDAIKRIGDYSGGIIDPLESLVQKIPRVLALAEKNKAMQSLVALKDQHPEVYKNILIPLKGGQTMPGMGVINVFENGVNKRYAVPDYVETAVKNLDAETANILVNLNKWQAQLLRAGATGLNIGFIPANIVRDIQDALTTELSEKGVSSMLRLIGNYPRAIFSAAKKDALYQQWLSAGGAQSTMTEQIFKSPTRGVKDLAGTVPLKTKINPIKGVKNLIEFANRVGEQSTRLARFQSGIKSGESAAEAAFKSRDISLDFAKSGNTIKVLNQVIPFLNAGIQGTEKLFRLYKQNPKAAAFYTSVMYGTPAYLLYRHNSQFQDYKDIPDAEKQTYWIMLARDRTPEEKANNDPIPAIKVPKGFLGRMVSNSVEASLGFMQERDPEGFANAMLDIASGISPIGVPYNGEKLGQTLSAVLPPGIQAGIEGVTNTNLFFGNKIVPQSLSNLPASEQYKEKTPGIYKIAGKLTGKVGISPLILENTVNSMTGGVGRQIATGFSGDIKGATIDQVTRKFAGARGGKQTDEAYKLVDKEKQYTALRNKQLKEAYLSGNMAEVERLAEGMSSKQLNTLIGNAVKEKSRSTNPEQRAYESLTDEEQNRLLRERPELKSSLIPQAGASGITFTESPESEQLDKTFNTGESTTNDTFQDTTQDSIYKNKVKLTGKPIEADNKLYYPKGKSVSVIDLQAKLTEPDFTGNTELDKRSLSKFSSEITKRKNEVEDLITLGKITADQGETLLQGLTQKLENVKASQKTQTNFELTGDPVIDKSIRSRFQGQITTQINDVVDYVQEGKLTPEQGRDIINRLNARRGSLSGGGSGGGRKKKVNYRGVKITAKPIKIPTLKLKLPKTKIPKYKPIKAIRVRYKS